MVWNGMDTLQRCIATGYPLASVQWLKDGQPLRTGSRVRLLTKEHIKITSVTKEDKGTYQASLQMRAMNSWLFFSLYF